MKTTLIWHRPSDLLPESDRHVLALNNVGKLSIMWLSGLKTWYTERENMDIRQIAPRCWAYVDVPEAIASDIQKWLKQ